MKDFNTVRLKDLYGAMLTDRQRDIVEQYYEFDLSLGEIAENLSVTRQAVHCALGQARSILEDCEEKLGFESKFEAIESILEKCGGIADAEEIKKHIAHISDVLRS